MRLIAWAIALVAVACGSSPPGHVTCELEAGRPLLTPCTTGVEVMAFPQYGPLSGQCPSRSAAADLSAGMLSWRLCPIDAGPGTRTLSPAERTWITEALRATTVDTAPTACIVDGPNWWARIVMPDGGVTVRSCYPFWAPEESPLNSSGLPALSDVLFDLASR